MRETNIPDADSGWVRPAGRRRGAVSEVVDGDARRSAASRLRAGLSGFIRPHRQDYSTYPRRSRHHIRREQPRAPGGAGRGGTSFRGRCRPWRGSPMRHRRRCDPQVVLAEAALAALAGADTAGLSRL